MESKNQKFKYLYCFINAGLLLLMLWCLIRAADKTGDTYMALLASCGAFAAFNGYWSINPNLYSWFHRNSETDRKDKETPNKTVDDNGFADSIHANRPMPEDKTSTEDGTLSEDDTMSEDKPQSGSKTDRRSSNMWLVLLIAGTAILVLCAVWFFFMRDNGTASISSAMSRLPSMRL